jgi:hypothetical protein
MGAVQFGPRSGHGVQGVIDALNALPLLERLDLWIGAVVAAGLIAITIRVRRHRDDN